MPPLPLSLRGLFSLHGKIAVIADAGGTGSREIGLLLASAGASIVIIDRDVKRGQAAIDDIVAEGGQAQFIDANVENEDAVDRAFLKAEKAFGGVDILVNCPAMLLNQPLLETTARQWDETQSLNLRSTFLCMREGVRAMLGTGRGGRIVNISTMGVLHPVLNGNGSYAAARAGVTALTRDVALDYAKSGILANTILAGAIKAKATTHPATAAAERSGRVRTGPLREGVGRRLLGYGDLTDIAAAVLYLVSPAGRYMTGQSVVLDGGFLIT